MFIVGDLNYQFCSELLTEKASVSNLCAERICRMESLFIHAQAMDHLESFIAECDRRTELAKKRLAETQEEISAEVAAKVLHLCKILECHF